MCRNRPIRLLVLDCDGVLVRSESANLAYYNHLFEAFGQPPVARDDREAVGRLQTLSTPQVIEAFFPPHLQPEVQQFARRADFGPFLKQVEPEPGWPAVLARWRRSGRTAVATNRGASAGAVLEAAGLMGLVDLVVTIRDVARPKPHPDLLLEALRHFRARAGEALYVGDSDLDRRAAEGAGVRFLGFRTPEPPAARDPAEVEAYLQGLAGGECSGMLRAAPP
jgi:phosphoglycolate phosphatase